jgi:hypothetical protein
MFEVHTQDYRGWRENHFDAKPPPVTIVQFATKEAADEAKARAKALGLFACVVLAKPVQAKRNRKTGQIR